MRLSFFLATLLCIVASCSSNKAPRPLSPSRIASQFFSVNPGSDTLLRTGHGTVLRFKKGTFSSDSPVDIEIKEVFTPADILRSGLTTLSNGRLLRSGGMLYFSATSNGKDIEPQLPVTTTIPSQFPDPEMQLFKAEWDEDSSLNWVDPAPLDTLPNQQDLIVHGRSLFNSACASCHNIHKDGTGPALKGVQYRGPWSNPLNLLSFINNPARFMSKDRYTQELKQRFGSVMTAFPDLTGEDLKMLLAYINDEATRIPGPVLDSTNVAAAFATFSPCLDTSYLYPPVQWEEFDTATEPLVVTDTMSWDIPDYYQITAEIFNTRQGYTFDITGNGWINIDAFMDETSETMKQVELKAELINASSPEMDVYLFLPNQRVLQRIYNRQGNVYDFSAKDGKIALPYGERAVVFAVSSHDYNMYYAIAEFTITDQQLIRLNVQETTEEKLSNILSGKNINGVEINATKREQVIDTLPCFSTAVYDTTSVREN